jgi:hypothetical protein
MPTPMRSVRIDDDLWEAVKAKAAAQGTTAAEVIVRGLRGWTGSPVACQHPAARLRVTCTACSTELRAAGLP